MEKIDVKKYVAEAVFNTWAKTGYLFDLGKKGGYFLCEYLSFMQPHLFIVEYSEFELRKINLNEKKIVFGGYQEFVFKEKFSVREASLILANIESKGLFSQVNRTDEVYKEIFKYLSKVDVEIDESVYENNISKLSRSCYDSNLLSYLGVQNFRNIDRYSSFNLKPVTFITGKNNSGKSSLLKSILLLKGLLYDSKKDKFVINQNSEIIKRLNLDFKTILNEKNSSDKICLALNLNFRLQNFINDVLKGEFRFKLVDNSLELDCFIVDFVDKKSNIDFILKLEETSFKKLAICKEPFIGEKDSQILDFEFENIPGIGFNSLFNIDNQHLPLINLLTFKLKDSISVVDRNGELYNLFNSISHLIDNLINEIYYVPSLRGDLKRSFSLVSDLGKSIEKLNLNKENNIKVKKLKYWLTEFEIADDYKIEELDNGEFELKLGKNNIADLGFGFMQLFPVLVNSIFTDGFFADILIIEEPEGNLHPNLQSKLADFFYDIYLEYDTQFIIETHSEYLIRKTQLIGLKNNLFSQQNNNPFSIIYYDQENGPYNLKYLQNGQFDKDFGSGFYDVVDDIALEIFINKQKK